MDYKMVLLQKVSKKKIVLFFKDYINELPASSLPTKSTIKNEFDF